MRAMRYPCVQSIIKCLVVSFLTTFCATSANATCSEMIDDSHFHKIYQNDAVRVYTLELGRLESTTTLCHEHPYFYVTTSESQTTDTTAGHAGWSHNWSPGEARWVAQPRQDVIRNETATSHYEVIVEILTRLEFEPLVQNYQSADFTGDLGSAKPTWTVSTEHGPMTAVKTQLGPGDKLDFSA